MGGIVGAIMCENKEAESKDTENENENEGTETENGNQSENQNENALVGMQTNPHTSSTVVHQIPVDLISADLESRTVVDFCKTGSLPPPLQSFPHLPAPKSLSTESGTATALPPMSGSSALAPTPHIVRMKLAVPLLLCHQKTLTQAKSQPKNA